MNKKYFSSGFGMIVVLSLVLTAFVSAAAPAPVAVLAKTTTAKFEPIKVEAPDCDYGGEFKSIEAVDEYTVKFTLCDSDPAFPSKVAFSVFAIADKDFLDANKGDSVAIGEKGNGTGPYKLVEWKKGDSIIYEANPDYWGEKAKVKNLIFKWSDQSAQRFLELNSGTFDGIDNPAPEDIEQLKTDANFAVYDREALNIFYIGLMST